MRLVAKPGNEVYCRLVKKLKKFKININIRVDNLLIFFVIVTFSELVLILNHIFEFIMF